MTASETPCLPSFFLESGLSPLKLDSRDADWNKVADKADEFQRNHNPGKPSVTMAAFVWLTVGARRYIKAVARAFDCTENSVSKRIRHIKEARK